MKNIIKQWSIPDILKERNIKFVFDSNEIIDKVNSLESKYSKEYYENLKYKICNAFKIKKKLPPPTLPYTGGVRGGS